MNEVKIRTWKNGCFREAESLLDVLGLSEEEHAVVSFIGAGGKTTTIRRMEAEYLQRGKKPVVTTTTHIQKRAESYFLTDPSLEEIRSMLEQKKQVWFGAASTQTGKVKGVSFEMLKQITDREGMADVLLIEADGARRLPCKAPAEHEPVIWDRTTHVLAVYGLDAIGKSIRESCFRAEYVSRILNKKMTEFILPEDIAVLGLSGDGGRKGVLTGMKYQIILNKADDEEKIGFAEDICRKLAEQGFTDVIVTAGGRQQETI